MITVFGSINLDYIGRVPRLPLPGETVTGSDLLVAPGGKGANQALAAARAGRDVRLIGATGDDPAADVALKLLRQEGVDLRHVEVTDHHTGTALIQVDDAGENSISVLPGANALVTSKQLEQSRIDPGDIVLFQMELPLDEICAAIQLGADRGARIIANLAPFRHLPEEIIKRIEVIVVNEAEARELVGYNTPNHDPEMYTEIKRLSKLYHIQIIQTLGSDGVVFFDADSHLHFPSFKVDVVDTVGAGDTFCGYLAAGLDQHFSLEKSIEQAIIAAGLACTTNGAQPSIPSNSDVISHNLG